MCCILRCPNSCWVHTTEYQVFAMFQASSCFAGHVELFCSKKMKTAARDLPLQRYPCITPTWEVKKCNSVIRLCWICFLSVESCEAFLIGPCFACGKQPMHQPFTSERKSVITGRWQSMNYWGVGVCVLLMARRGSARCPWTINFSLLTLTWAVAAVMSLAKVTRSKY